MYGTSNELWRRRGDDDGDALFASPESTAGVADYTYPPYGDMPFSSVKRRKQLQRNSGNDLVKLAMKAVLASPLVVLVVWSAVAVLFSHKHARSGASANRNSNAAFRQTQFASQQHMSLFNGKENAGNSNNNNNNRHSFLRIPSRWSNQRQNSPGVASGNRQYQMPMQQQQQQAPQYNLDANVPPQRMVPNGVNYQMPIAQQQPMSGMPANMVSYNQAAMQQIPQQQLQNGQSVQSSLDPMVYSGQSYPLVVQQQQMQRQQQQQQQFWQDQNNNNYVNAPPQQHLVTFDRNSHTVTHEGRQKLQQFESEPMAGAGENANGDGAFVGFTSDVQQAQPQQHIVKFDRNSHTVSHERQNMPQPMAQLQLGETTDGYAQNSELVDSAQYTMSNGADGSQVDQAGSAPQVYYYDPAEVRSGNGLQIPRTVYDSQGNAVPIQALQGSQVLMQAPMQQAVQSSSSSSSSSLQSNANKDGGSAAGNLENALINASTQQMAMPKSPVEWSTSPAQQNNIIVCTVAIMALLVGALSARKLRTRALLSACIENESIEDELAYDEAHTTQHSTADSYNTFGTNTPAAWNGDLEKFDV